MDNPKEVGQLLANTTNQREADKFVANDAGETAIRTIVDSHEVEVNNLPTEYPLPAGQIQTLTPPDAITGFATSTNQTDGGQKTQLVDDSGNVVGSHVSVDGDYHLGVQMEQNVVADSNNSSTTNLTSTNSYTFTGTGTSTLGVVGLQWSLKTDQNATVYIEESPDGTNWDISYPFDYIAAKGGRGETVQATQAYWRIRVVLTGTTDTTYFRLAGILCPIATPLPSDLSHDGRLKTESHISGIEDRHVWVNPTNELAVSPVYRMIGTSFDGSTKDPNFWTDGSLRDGTVTQSGGEVELDTNTTANGLALYQSVRKARFVAGSAQLFSGAVNWVTAGTADNTRRVGAYTLDVSLDVEDGFYFQLAGTTFSIGYARAGTPTLVNSGSFNGNYGSAWTPTADTYYKIAIEFTPMVAFWYINGKLLHKVNAAHMSDTETLPITIENENTGDSTTSVVFDSVGLYIARQGELHTNSTYYHISGNAATHILKYGAGVLHKIIFNNTSGTSITIYDNTSAAAPIMGVITTILGIIGSQDYDIPFSNGLTLVTVGNNLDATIVYE